MKPIPDNYPRVTPYLAIEGAADAIEFYKDIFGAEEKVRMDGPGGKIGHAELAIGDAMVMLADVFPEAGGKSPKELGGSPVTLMVYVEDVDDTYQRALDKGATAERKVENQFYGDRAGSFVDPFGHIWHVASHVEDVPDEEMARRAKEMMGG
jgi:PhnB protein